MQGAFLLKALRGQLASDHSATAWLVAVLLIIVWLSAGSASAQISPGPLARAHRTLEGTSHCVSCHQFGRQAALKCVECHTEIGTRVSAHRGLHATYGLQAGSSQGCAKCHSDHNGLDFPLVKWTPTPAGFDHSKTGYDLVGKHAGVACNKCHSAEHVAPSEKLSIQVRDLNKTFLGAPQPCIACHQDAHNGHLGQKCERCHNFEDWKNLSQFDHSKTKYPLTGLHAPVACQKCHTLGPDNKPRWVGLAFGKCDDCHADPHKGSFKQQACSACHNTSGWKRSSLQTINEKFDHSKTKYPLLGKHQTVGCSECHLKADFKKPLPFQKCIDCHKDVHNAQFAKRKTGIECAPCHTVETFKPSTFGVKEHATSKYPLEGKHAEVKCEGCHLPKGKDTLYKVKFAQCMDCHKDEHQRQFAGGPYLNRCEQCHNLKGWRPSTFSLAQHKKTRFELTGGHIPTPCSDCHKERPTAEFPHLIQYKFENRACTVCHDDPHKGQFNEHMQQAGTDGAVAGCEVCHSANTWNDLTRFDHDKTKFALLGAHRATACIDCHKPPNLETTLKNVNYKEAPKECEPCHEDVHGSQFAKPDRTTPCDSCHDSARWKPSRFDHETRTQFSLKGAHERVRCEACHKELRVVMDKSVLFYKPCPKECSACHGPGIAAGKS